MLDIFLTVVAETSSEQDVVLMKGTMNDLDGTCEQHGTFK